MTHAVIVCNLCKFQSTDEKIMIKHMRKEHPVEFMLALKGAFTMNPVKEK